jgi:outer membrane protein TolC
MDSKTKLEIKESDFADFQVGNIPTNEELALENRKDLESIRLRKASVANVQIAKSGYYPSISIIGGYTALNLQNIITVQNAMNIGVRIL